MSTFGWLVSFMYLAQWNPNPFITGTVMFICAGVIYVVEERSQ